MQQSRSKVPMLRSVSGRHPIDGLVTDEDYPLNTYGMSPTEESMSAEKMAATELTQENSRNKWATADKGVIIISVVHESYIKAWYF
jgi:hypothetical protein